MSGQAGSLAIDWTRCDRHGLCAALAPELVTLDEWGFPLLRSSAAADLADLRAVAAVCPALALRVERVGR